MGEKHILEYKRQWDDEWLKWLCGFANADGGTLYIGISDKQHIIGVDNSKKLMEDIPKGTGTQRLLCPQVERHLGFQNHPGCDTR